MDSLLTNPNISAAIARVVIVDGPHCSAGCRAGCSKCFANVEYSDGFDGAYISYEQVGSKCECGERCTDDAYVLDGVAYHSLECCAYAILWEHHPEQDQCDANRDTVIAAIEAQDADVSVHTAQTIVPGAVAL